MSNEGYIVDYYALFSVSRSASPDEISDAYRTFAKNYHPDMNRSPAYQKDGANKMTIANEGYGILSDPETRETYDQKLSTWRGQISTDGTPVYTLEQLFAETNRDRDPDEVLAEMDETLRTVSGFQPETFTLLSRLAQEQNAPADVRAAYEEMTAAKENYLHSRESTLWNLMSDEKIASLSSPIYLEEIMECILLVREKVLTDYEENVRQITERPDGILLLQSRDTAQTTVMATDHKEKFMAKIDAIMNHIKSVAKERTSLAEERLKSISLEYYGTKNPSSDTVAICLKSEGVPLWMAFRKSEDCVDSIAVDKALFKTQEGIDQWIEVGGNAVSFTVLSGIDPFEQIKYVLNVHFDFLEEKSDSDT